MLTDYLQQLSRKENLSMTHCQTAMQTILEGSAPPEQTAALLALLHAKPETLEELLGMVYTLQQQMIPVPCESSVLDIVGTGGDGSNSINISTAASLVVASLGVKVAKHGNRAISSRCGSADLLEALDIPIQSSPIEVQQRLANQNFAFMLATNFHPTLKVVSSVRRTLGIRTTFNLIGPLLNPARPDYCIVGVYEPRLLTLFADVLQRMPIKRALVVHGNGLDEISCTGPTTVIEITPFDKKQYSIDPRKLGFDYCTKADLQGGDAETNKKLILAAFNNQPGPILDTIILNAAVALHLVGECHYVETGIVLAREAIESGRVLNFVERLKNEII